MLGKQTDKVDAKAREAILIANTRETHRYKLWDIHEGKVVVSRDVEI